MPFDATGWRSLKIDVFAAMLTFLCCAVSTHGDAPRPAPDRMPAIIEEFTADREALAATYAVRVSPMRLERFKKFFTDEQAKLQALNFETLSDSDKLDYLLLQNHLSTNLHRLAIEERRVAEMNSLIPFAKTIEVCADDLRLMRRPNPEKAAGELTAMVKQIEQAQKAFDSKLDAKSEGGSDSKLHTEAAEKQKINPVVAYRAAQATEQLSAGLTKWFNFYNSYDPQFTWWMGIPYKDAKKALANYQGFLKKRLVGIEDDDKTTIVGDPVGRDALLADLQDNMIPYTPEELIAIAQTEMDWCTKEMLKASREMGYGDDWHKALEHVKQMHVAPGEQPELIRKLVVQGSEFVKQHDMVTVPALADETWRMIMMTPKRQLVNPFFTGGDEISVSYPTDTMTFEQREMSMRGNNIPFAHATAFHEMIPGHFLQFYMGARYHNYRQVFETPFWGEGDAFQWEMEFYDLGFNKTPEERVGALFWRMHRSARVMFTMRFHLGEWTPKQCIDFLIDQVGHEPDNAAAEVRRSFDGSVGPLYQCAYLMGALQIRALRKELVDSHQMTERQFHDALLHEGPMPIELLRADLKKQKLARDFKTSWEFYGSHPAHP